MPRTNISSLECGMPVVGMRREQIRQNRLCGWPRCGLDDEPDSSGRIQFAPAPGVQMGSRAKKHHLEKRRCSYVFTDDRRKSDRREITRGGGQTAYLELGHQEFYFHGSWT